MFQPLNEEDLKRREGLSKIFFWLVILVFGLCLIYSKGAFGQELQEKQPIEISQNYEIYQNIDGSKTLRLWQTPVYERNFFTGELQKIQTPSESFLQEIIIQPIEEIASKSSFLLGKIALADTTLSVNSADNLIYDRAPTTNYGSDTTSGCWYDPAGSQDRLRCLQRWVLPNISGTITSASISLKTSTYRGSGNISLHQLSNHLQWSETESSWVNAWTGGGDHTWDTAGGDYSATAIDTVAGATLNNWTTFYLYGSDSDNPLSTLSLNSTVNLIGKSETETGGSARGITYHSKEASSSSDRPYMTIIYTPTTPTPTPTPTPATELSTESIPLLQEITRHTNYMNILLIFVAIIGIFDLMRRTLWKH